MTPNTSVDELKAILTEKGGPPADYMYLLCNTKSLEEGRNLAYYNIENGSTIMMLFRVKGSCATCQVDEGISL